MQIKLATRTQRLLVYLIDYVLPCVIVSNIFLPLFYKIINFDTSVGNLALGTLTEELLALAADSTHDTSLLFQSMMEYFKYYMVNLSFTILFTFIILVGYLIILPRFWSKQTLGRMVTKTKVVKKNCDELDLKTIIMREGVGTILMYAILGNAFGFGILLASIILAYIDGRSLVDYIGKTCLITEKDEAGEYPNSPMINYRPNNDVIDAKVDDVHNDTDNGNDKNDDEYTVI